jgi:nucleotidyltransferase substrate binding protein (TIGR01987 family)
VERDGLSPLLRALATLGELEKETFSPAIRDAWIKRFDYSLEACWKSMRRVLGDRGITAYSPKEVIRLAASEGLIDSPDRWLDYIDKRNLTSHIYNEEVANEVYAVIADFRVDARRLAGVLSES